VGQCGKNFNDDYAVDDDNDDDDDDAVLTRHIV